MFGCPVFGAGNTPLDRRDAIDLLSIRIPQRLPPPLQDLVLAAVLPFLYHVLAPADIRSFNHIILANGG